MHKKPPPSKEVDHLALLEASKDLRVDPHAMLEALGKMSRGEKVGVESELNEGK